MKPGFSKRGKTIDSDDIEFTIEVSNEPFASKTAMVGGTSIWNPNDTQPCTQSWTVNGTRGKGVFTAGHCTGRTKTHDYFQNSSWDLEYNDDFYNGDGKDANLVSSFYGPLGDVAYYTVNDNSFYPYFHSDHRTLRWVDSFMPTHTMQGRRVCFYRESP